MGFEDRFLGNLDRRMRQETREAGDRRIESLNSSMNTLIPTEYKEAKRYNESAALDMESLRDVYGEEVDEDKEKVEKLRSIFARRDRDVMGNGVTGEQVRQLAEISESFLLRGFNESNWIPSCGAIKTSEFDDYINGVDLVLEYKKAENPANHLGLAIDVTYSNNLERKLVKIKEEIANGTLSEVKYFHSPNSRLHKKLESIPRGVVGFDVDTMSRISKFRQEHGEMPKHDPLKSLSFHQLSMQMRSFSEYAEEVNSPSIETLKRTSQFVELLTKYVKSTTPNFDKSVLESEQVRNLSKALERFGKL